MVDFCLSHVSIPLTASVLDAGSGRNKVWFNALPHKKKFECELEDGVDFLKLETHYDWIIGNPPFGNRSRDAIAFLKKALSLSNNVGFLLPISFRKWSVQQHIDKKARLVLDVDLPIDAFKIKGLRTCFQVWSTQDLRLTEKPSISHPDFEMWLYNDTKASEGYFEEAWDFAVPRQGYFCVPRIGNVDYTTRATSKEQCDKRKHWMMFSAKTPEVLEQLLAIDYGLLAHKNTIIPGFGKADVVAEYKNILKRIE